MEQIIFKFVVIALYEDRLNKVEVDIPKEDLSNTFIPNEFLNNKIIIINLGVGAEQNE